MDYRLAPEHRYPAALDDALAAYAWLIDQGFAPKHTALAGDSAGGGLALSLLLRLRDAGKALPAAAGLMSAWTDLTASGASYSTRADADPIHQRPMIVAMARNYLGKDGNAADPLVSPLFADLRGLPPLLAQVGDRETVLDDSRDFVARAKEAGGRCHAAGLGPHDPRLPASSRRSCPKRARPSTTWAASFARHLAP